MNFPMLNRLCGALAGVALVGGLAGAVFAQEAPAPLGWSGTAAPSDPAPGTRRESVASPAVPKAPGSEAGGVGSSAAASKPAAPKVEKTHFSVTKEIEIDERQRVEAKLADLLGDPRLKDHPVGQVVVRGQAVPDESSPNGRKVNVQWESVAFQESGRSADFANPFVSRLLAEGVADGRITEGTRLPAYGDTDDAVYTIRSLFLSEEEAQEELAKRPERTVQKPPSARSASANPIAEDFKSLEPNEGEDDTPVITYEECRPRVDTVGKQVFPQNKTISTSKSGTETGACEDSGFPIPFSYTAEGCGDEVDLEAGFAYPLRRAFFTSQNGREFVTGCEKDEEFKHALVAELGKCEPVVNLTDLEARETYELGYLDRSNNWIVVEGCDVRPDSERYAISASSAQCTPDIDLDAAKATLRTALVYTSRYGNEVVADECAVREGNQAFDILDTMDGCLYRPDFDGQVAVQQKRKVYQNEDGQLVSLSVCTDSETVYPMSQTRDGCSIRLDYQAGEAVELLKWVADLPTGREDVSACAPSGNTSEIVETVEGCEAVHYDYFEAGYSRGASRLYHTLDGGRTYLSECAENTTTYDHSFERAGWSHNDTALESVDLLEVYIDIPAGRTLISNAAVRANSVIVPYLPRGLDSVATGQSRYDGCNAYRQTTQGDKYERGDGSMVVLNGRPGPEQGPENVCQESAHSTSNLIRSYVLDSGGDDHAVSFVRRVRENMTKYRTYNTENGASISFRCAWSGGATSEQVFAGQGYTTARATYNGYTSGSCPAHNSNTSASCQVTSPTPCPF